MTAPELFVLWDYYRFVSQGILGFMPEAHKKEPRKGAIIPPARCHPGVGPLH